MGGWKGYWWLNKSDANTFSKDKSNENHCPLITKDKPKIHHNISIIPTIHFELLKNYNEWIMAPGHFPEQETK